MTERTTVRFTGDDEDLHEHLKNVADERDRSMNYLILDAVRQVYGDEGRTEAMQSDAERIEPEQLDEIRRRLDALEDAVGLDVDAGDVDQEDADLRGIVDAVDWDDVMVARTDERVDALTAALRRLREQGEASPSQLREAMHDAVDVGLSESSEQRMLSDVLGQVDAVESAGQGSHKYIWRE